MPECRNCKTAVDRSAKACPKCGADKPATGAAAYNAASGVQAVVTIAIFYFVALPILRILFLP